MPIGRRELDTKPPTSIDVENKARLTYERGTAYAALKESNGWKRLLSEHISHIMDQRRYLQAKNRIDAEKVRLEQKTLFELLSFIDRSIEDGEKARQQLLIK